MTISTSDRREYAKDLLRRIFECVGLDRDYDAVFVDPTAAEFSDIPATTWAELCDWRRLKIANEGFGFVDYRLTGSGWVEGLRLAGLATVARERCIGLLKALKGVADRHSHSESMVTLEQLAAASGTTTGWCFNALHSGFLTAEFPDRRVDVRVEYPLVFVPPNFGHERIKLFNQSTSAYVPERNG